MKKLGVRKEDLGTPVLWVDLDSMEENIAYLAEYFRNANKHWRPHIKGIQVPAIAHMALSAGAIGVTCATVYEAERMAAAGIRDILIANQVVGVQNITRLVFLRKQAEVKAAVDNVQNIGDLGRAASRTGVELDVLVEVDIGMKRAGVAPGRETVDMAHLVENTSGLHFVGLLGWEGHTRSISDHPTRDVEIEKSIRILGDTAENCQAAGLDVQIVSAGGTGTFHVTAYQSGVTELEVGGAVFSDVTSQKWGVETDPALFVQTMITSKPSSDRVIFDAGFKALPIWKNPPSPVGVAGTKNPRSYAAHGMVTLENPMPNLKVGDILDFVVSYGDHTLLLYDTLYGVRNSEVESAWSIR